MLRIEFQRNSETVTIKLMGQVAGRSVAKLNRAWIEFAPSLGSMPLSIDLINVTQADLRGVRALRHIQSLTGAKIITTSPLTRYVAEDVARHSDTNAFRMFRGTTPTKIRLRTRRGTI